MEGECTSCNAGAELSGGACYLTPTDTITVEDGAADVQSQGMISTPHGDSGATFLSDEGAGKGERWVVFSAAVDVSGTYEVHLLVPPADYCTPRSSSVPVIIYHSGTGRRTVIDADLSSASPVSLGSFYFDSTVSHGVRVIVDNKGTAGCVGVDALQLVPSSAQKPSTGCTDSAALNFEQAASSDDGSCIYVGGRGLVRQQWALMDADVEEKVATASPASVLQESVVVDRACPAPGDELSGWEMLTGDTEDCSAIGSRGTRPGDDCNADSRCTYNDGGTAAACTADYAATCRAIGSAGTAAGDDCNDSAVCTYNDQGTADDITDDICEASDAAACAAESANGEVACRGAGACTYDSGTSDDACEPSYTDCVSGRCPSHDACPENTFCCLDGSHTRCV